MVISCFVETVELIVGFLRGANMNSIGLGYNFVFLQKTGPTIAPPKTSDFLQRRFHDCSKRGRVV